MMATLGALSSGALAGCTSGGDGEGTDTQTNTATDGGTTNAGGQQTTTQADVSASGTVKVGIMQPMSGDLQYYGMQAIWGFLSGLAYRTDSDPLTDVQTGTRTVEDDDVTWELVFKDTQFSADVAQTAATDLVQQDDVDVLFGCSSSGSATRVAQTVVNTSGVDVPFIAGPAASADVTANGDTCSDQVFRANENTAMDARSGGTYAAQETDIQRVFLMGADYSFGRAVVNNYRTVLEANGIEIVGERFVPQGYSEFEGLFEQAVSANADAVVGGFTVATLPNFMTTAANYDLRIFGGFATEITNAVVGQVLTNLLGEPLTAQKIRDAEIGPFTTRYHWNQYSNDINTAFVDMYTNAYGKVPDLFTSGTFTAASSVHQAVQASGSTEGVDIASSMKGMTVADTPKGTDAYTYQEYNNQARSEMTVAYPVPTTDEFADSWGASIMPGEPVARVSKDQTTIPADDPGMGCDL
ncbi:ABC transporter substrate-binding protein [Haloarchaeobius iranensis]|uniref:Amino acid/amide ABC transporter substrate-binding protein, HAAT family n=1 Tax=Haloarchaeobius iranensis TaxID=996166 RepID=A0A1G9SDJ7_9EURY|nr:ABC transporter substrate-binding protein [Haloarchaeobius iranensis]SDM33566.1 amino acid/amide ABC transporter substrate-binding protein, HAAT family [Haloarchaeobius iranensis]